MGNINLTGKKKKAQSTASILLSTSIVNPRPQTAHLSEEKNETPAAAPYLTPQMTEIIARCTLDERLPLNILTVIACNRALADKLFLLNGFIPLTRKIIIDMANHEKYALKIIDSILLLDKNGISLNEECIHAIANAEFELERVCSGILNYAARFFLTEKLVIGIANAKYLALPVSNAFLMLSSAHIELTKKIINAISKSDDPLLLADAFAALHANQIALSEIIVAQLAKAETHALVVANGLISIHNAKMPPLTDQVIINIATSKNEAEKRALFYIHNAKVLTIPSTKTAPKREEECAPDEKINVSRTRSFSRSAD